MRLWHKALLPYLPTMQLKGQYREIFLIVSSIRKQGTPNHILVNKVMEYPLTHLAAFLQRLTEEMTKRNIKYNQNKVEELYAFLGDPQTVPYAAMFEVWHNDRYLRQCLHNLQEKADCGRPTAEEWEKLEGNFQGYL